MEQVKIYLLKYKWRIAGITIGAIAGFMYWYYIGCTSGTCPIQSNWHSSTLFGGIFGYLLSDFKKKKPEADGTV